MSSAGMYTSPVFGLYDMACQECPPAAPGVAVNVVPRSS